MKKTLFDDLVQSLREAKEIASGKMVASRRFESGRPRCQDDTGKDRPFTRRSCLTHACKHQNLAKLGAAPPKSYRPGSRFG